MKKVKIRYAKKEDAEWLKEDILEDENARLKLNIRGNGEGKIFKLDDTWSVSFVAEVEGKPAGIVTVEHYSLSSTNSIEELYVRKSYRNNGIATILLCKAEKYACENWPAWGMRALTIENPKMEKLLKKQGYKLMGRVKDWYVFNLKSYDQNFYFKRYKKGIL